MNDGQIRFFDRDGKEIIFNCKVNADFGIEKMLKEEIEEVQERFIALMGKLSELERLQIGVSNDRNLIYIQAILAEIETKVKL